MTRPRKLIVLIDDSASVRLFFEHSLRERDIDLIAFSVADDALPLLRHQRPDLVFLDIIMPDKDGLTFLQELRRLPLQSKTPVVIITSKDYAQDRQTAKALGAVEFVAKPMSVQTILGILERHLPVTVEPSTGTK